MNINFHINKLHYFALFITLTSNFNLKCAATIPSEQRGEISDILNQQLKEAIEKGDKVEQENIIKTQQTLKLRNAIDQNDITEVEKLIKEGVDVNRRAGPVPPLLQAGTAGNVDIVKLLIDAGADLHAESLGGRRALFDAAWTGQKNIAKILLLAGSNVNIKHRSDEHTALMNAAGQGRKDIVQLLLAFGADLGIADINGKTAIDYARQVKTEDNEQTRKNKLEISKILEAEPARRAAAVKSWNDRASEIAKLLDERLGIKPLGDIVLDYEAKPVEKFEDLPLDYRLEGFGIK